MGLDSNILASLFEENAFIKCGEALKWMITTINEVSITFKAKNFA
ncbi:hypothetical protein PROVRUST_05690 [Providencia rustigianii DSM 4541]|uniref:Uncharacterized protein n=1 Tax=Providencia rustigianii DSM 4541 TaxID=500637 RepID=D1P0M3_9GAMM|nr:hypothetical protein PROVRUST_05690 [Providencia rustigianii DSM 4541]